MEHAERKNEILDFDGYENLVLAKKGDKKKLYFIDTGMSIDHLSELEPKYRQILQERLNYLREISEFAAQKAAA